MLRYQTTTTNYWYNYLVQSTTRIKDFFVVGINNVQYSSRICYSGWAKLVRPQKTLVLGWPKWQKRTGTVGTSGFPFSLPKASGKCIETTKK